MKVTLFPIYRLRVNGGNMRHVRARDMQSVLIDLGIGPDAIDFAEWQAGTRIYHCDGKIVSLRKTRSALVVEGSDIVLSDGHLVNAATGEVLVEKGERC